MLRLARHVHGSTDGPGILAADVQAGGPTGRQHAIHEAKAHAQKDRRQRVVTCQHRHQFECP